MTKESASYENLIGEKVTRGDVSLEDALGEKIVETVSETRTIIGKDSPNSSRTKNNGKLSTSSFVMRKT